MVTKKPFLALAAVLLVGLGIFACNYGYIQYVSNKGPDDWGAQTFAENYLNEKYGKHDGTMSITVTNFKPKEDALTEGLYSIDCTYKGVSTTIHVYYNGKEFSKGSDDPK